MTKKLAKLALLFCFAASAGCADDPSLTVTVVHGTNTFALTETRVDVYESETVTCEKLRWGLLSLDAIAPFRINTPAQDDAVLTGLPRSSRSILVAKGFVGTALAMVGCAEVEKIEAGSTVQIATVPVALVSTQTQVLNGGTLEVTVTTTDFNATPIKDRKVRWSIVGPSGATFTGAQPASYDAETFVIEPDALQPCTAQTCTGGRGRLAQRFSKPSLSGPFAVLARPEWALNAPSPVTQFAGTLAEIDTSIQVPIAKRFFNPCTVFRPSGMAASLACVQSFNIVNGTFEIVQFSLINGQLVPQTIPVPSFGGLSGKEPAAVLADLDGVYVLSRAGRWRRVLPTVATVDTLGFMGFSGTVLQAIAMPACGTLPASVAVLAKESNTEPQLMTTTMQSRALSGGPIVSKNFALQSAGCVTNVGLTPDVPYQVVFGATHATDNTNSTTGTVGAYGALRTAASSQLTTPIFVSRFLAAGVIENGEQRILTADVDVTGAVIQESLLTSRNDGTDSSLLVRRTLPSVAVPSRIASGFFDQGNGPDLMWLIPQEQTSFVQVMLDRTIGEQALSALYQQDFSGVIETGNFDETGASDIVSWGIGEDATGTAIFRVAVMPLSSPVN